MIGNQGNSKSFIYSGGELHVEIEKVDPNMDVCLGWRIQSSDDLMHLLMQNEIIDRIRKPGTAKRLVLPYFPYARQDRVTAPLTAFSLKVMAKLINDMKFDEVVILDPHSDVTPALIERVRVVSQFDLITTWFVPFREWINETRPMIVAPDAGATKKSQALATHFGLPFVAARKYRDCETGEISGTHIDGAVNDMYCLIVDDICDGGRTFTELAKELRVHGAHSVALYVTHGIFSKGYGVFNGLIDRIYTTDSFLPKEYPIGADQPTLFVKPLPYMEL